MYSLQIWVGFKPENLAKHELSHASGSYYLRGEDGSLKIGTYSCVPCHEYFGGRRCPPCPLAIVRSGTPCDKQLASESQSPLGEWLRHNNPNPMIAWLEKAAEYKPAVNDE